MRSNELMANVLEQATDRMWGSSEPPSGVRGTLDVLVQSCLVDLFAAYGVALAPSPRMTPERTPLIPDMSAAIGFTQLPARTSGKVTLSLPSGVVQLMKGEAGTSLRGDWVRELTNQLLGRIKNRMLQLGVRLEMGTSLNVDGKTLASQLQGATGVRLYGGRTLRGNVLASLIGAPADHELKYVAAPPRAAEGSAILF